jgi:diaminopimelate epimerase
MSGSGNDFVFFDARAASPGPLAEPETIQQICARRTGVGADGIVFLEPYPEGEFRMRYYNADGSRASLCGNAALCSSWLAVELGFAAPEGFRFATDAGVLAGRIRDGLPEVDLEPIREIVPDVAVDLGEGESRIGFALAGVPHAVILCADAEAVQVDERGRTVRWSPVFREGANVDFVSRVPGGWRMRTYERGVEGETLACGTGAVACAAVLAAWAGGSVGTTRILTSSGLPLDVSFRADGGVHRPSLRGSARLAFRGTLGAIDQA